METKKLLELMKDETFAKKMKDNADRIMEDIKRPRNHFIDNLGGMDEINRQVEELNNERKRAEKLQNKREKTNFIIGLSGVIIGVLGLIVAIIALFQD